MSKGIIQSVPHGMVGRCEECNQVFLKNPPHRLTHCVKCKKVSPKELKALMNFEGGKVVEVRGGAAKLVR